MNKIAIGIAAGIFLVVAALVDLLIHYSGKASELDTVQAQADSQTAIIAKQAFIFQQSNNIAQAAALYEVKLVGDTQEKEIEYRTILQKEPTCDLFIPDSIAGGLYDYANRLRSGAMSGDPGGITETASDTTTARRMTYCQAVLWINPLLAVIDQGNNQLSSIRKIEGLTGGKAYP